MKKRKNKDLVVGCSTIAAKDVAEYKLTTDCICYLHSQNLPIPPCLRSRLYVLAGLNQVDADNLATSPRGELFDTATSDENGKIKRSRRPKTRKYP